MIVFAPFHRAMQWLKGQIEYVPPSIARCEFDCPELSCWLQRDGGSGGQSLRDRCQQLGWRALDAPDERPLTMAGRPTVASG